MSNQLALAAVTRVLQGVVQHAVGDVVPGAGVVTRRPERAADPGQENASVNVLLMQVAPNTAWRNEDLPARTAAGVLRARPRLALDLFYLLTFHGDDATLVPQRMLGAVLTALNTTPQVSPATIRAALAGGVDGVAGPLTGSDLADQVESITLTLQRLSLEELSKIWSVLLQVPYSLSALYVASVVVLEPDLDVVEALAVGTDGVRVTVRNGGTA